MRDAQIVNGFNNLQRLIALIDDQTKTALAGEMMMQQAMRKLLVEKGIFTDKELSDSLSKIIEAQNKAAKEAEEKKAKQLITPTTAQAAQVTASRAETEEQQSKPSKPTQ